MFADITELDTVNFQSHVGTNISKKSVKSKIAIKNALDDISKHAGIELNVKE